MPNAVIEHLFYDREVANGGYGQGAGIPLRDRIRVDAPAAATSPPVPEEPAYPGRHCWVVAPVDGLTARPGLLLEWRKVGHLWEGRVVYVAALRAGRWTSVEEWVPAELLTTTGD